MKDCPATAHVMGASTRWFQDAGFDDAASSVVNGRPWLLVTSTGWRRRGAVDRLEKRLGRPAAEVAAVPPNPPSSMLLDAPFVDAPSPSGINGTGIDGSRIDGSGIIVVALGGGSVIDIAKGVAAVLHLPPAHRPEQLAAHLHRGRPWPPDLEIPAIVAIPTTTGTGSEVTPWGTLWDGDRKTSIDDERLRPAAAVLDPSLAARMPRMLALSSGLDALAHALESVWNRSHTPLTDALASQAIASLWADLERHLAGPPEIARVARLQAAAALAGLAMNGTRTALAHSISYALTARWGLDHGLGCGLVLGEIARRVRDARPDRLAPVARALGVGNREVPETLDAWLSRLGIGDAVRRFPAAGQPIPGTALVHPARAGNFLLEADADLAARVLEGALARHCPPTRNVHELTPTSHPKEAET